MLLGKLDRNDPGGEWSTSDDDTSAFSLNSISILCCEGEMLVNKLISDGRWNFIPPCSSSPRRARQEACMISRAPQKMTHGTSCIVICWIVMCTYDLNRIKKIQQIFKQPW